MSAKAPAPRSSQGHTAGHRERGRSHHDADVALGAAPSSEAAQGQPRGPSDSTLRRSTWRWIRAAAIAVTLFTGYQLLLVVGGIVSGVIQVALYVVFGGVLALLALPAVDALERYARIGRVWATLLVLVSGFATVVLLLYVAAGTLLNEAQSLSREVPGLIQRGEVQLDQLRGWLSQRGIHIQGGGIPGGDPGQYATRVASALATGIVGTFNVLIDTVVVIVVAFWLLKDGRELRAGLVNMLPSRLRSNVDFAFAATAVVIGGYVRAQLFMAAIIGVLAGLGCALLGVPFPLVVGLTAGVFELVPLVGPFIGGAVALLLALTVSPTLALFTLLLFVGLHIVEGYILAPRIQEKFVRLHPLLALLALFTGIEVGGFLGALFAVPTASLVAVFVRAAIGDLRASRPDLFAPPARDAYLERRRHSILGEFRIFRRSPVDAVRARLGLAPRQRPRDSTE